MAMTEVDCNLQRRSLLGTAWWAGAAWSLSRIAAAQAAGTAEAPIRRAIPASGELLPVVGIGTNSFQLANAESLGAVLARLQELGGAWIDTAAAYGESEEVIGRLLQKLGIRSRMFLATKLVGDGVPRVTGPGALGSEWDGVTGRASLERSLKRLRTDHVDLLQVHSLRGLDTVFPQMQDWRRAGLVRYLGVTTSSVTEHPLLLAAMRKYPLDFIQVDYSLGNRAAAEQVLPLAQSRRIGVSINLPLGGKRRTLIQEAAGRSLPSWAADFDAASWSQFFLKYVVAHPAVTCVVPGSTRLEHLEDNQRAARGRLPDAARRRQMEQYWDRDAEAGA